MMLYVNCLRADLCHKKGAGNPKEKTKEKGGLK